MTLRLAITPNGNHTHVEIGQPNGSPSISGTVNRSNPQDRDRFLSQVETTLGAAVAGTVATELDAEDGEQQEQQPFAAAPLSVGELLKKHPHLRQPRIEGLLRHGETMNIIAPPKYGKSWTVQELAIQVAIGGLWLGKFQTHQTNVLVLDNELHPQTFANRLPKIASARGIDLRRLADTIFVENLRGRLKDIAHLGAYFKQLPPGKFGLVILDAFYRALPAGTDENDNGAMANVYNMIDAYADQVGCSFVLIHHASKGIQSYKSVTDSGSGAGAQSRAADTHFVMRQHETDGAIVIDAAVRSWPPLSPFCMRWDFPVWHLADDLDPTQLRQERRKQRKEHAEEEPAKPEWTRETFTTRFIGIEPQTIDEISVEAGIEKISDRKARQFIKAAEARHLIHRWHYGPKKPVKYSTAEQPITAGAA